MLNLVLNENMKIYRRIRTWIMIGLLVIITVVTSMVIFNFQPKGNSNWQENTKHNITNTDLTQHIEGRPFFAGMTMSFSLIVLLVYFVIFNALSWGIFKKRDVAA